MNNTINFVWKLVNPRTVSGLLSQSYLKELLMYPYFIELVIYLLIKVYICSTNILTFNLSHEVARIFFLSSSACRNFFSSSISCMNFFWI